ncbi:outer membrane beta-barrel protein [Ekhidna sp.]
MKNFIILMTLCVSTIVNSQQFNVSGRVLEDGSGESMIGSTVLFVNVKDSLKSAFTSVNTDGSFTVKNLNQAFYQIRIQSLGYRTFRQYIRVTQDMTINPILLESIATELDEVVVEAEEIAVQKKGDTVLYKAGAYTVNPDATAADLVSKMPGMVVGDGTVESNGESVRQVLVDGKQFFGQDPLLALNTIPAEVVNQIEVFDQQSERARATGFDDGNTIKTMNVVTKEGKRQGEFGRIRAGVGTDERHWIEGNLNSFKNRRQLTLLGLTNDINKSDFSNSDASGGRGGQRGGNRFFGGGAAQAPTGITNTQTFGFNYSNEGEENKWRLESSYFYDRSRLDNIEETQRTFFGEQQGQVYNEQRASDSDNTNHRLNARGEYQINDKNTIIYTPSVTIQDFSSVDRTSANTVFREESLNATENDFTTVSNAYDVNNNLIYRHKFGKQGRSMFTELNFNTFNSEGEDTFRDFENDSTTIYQNERLNNTYAAEVGYIEPVGKSGQVQIGYELRQEDRERIINTIEFDETNRGAASVNDALSGNLNSELTYHRPSVNYSVRSFSNFFSAGLAFQHSQFDNANEGVNTSLDNRSFNVLLPTFFGRIPITNKVDMFMRYSTSTSAPSTSQLQEVIDNSNPLFLSVGNSNLDQSYTHQLFMRIAKTNVEKNTSISNFSIINTTSNFITNGTFITPQDSTLAPGIVLERGAQLASPVNIDGYWNVRNNTTYSFVLEAFKLNVNATAGVSYIRNPGLVNGIENISETFNLNSRLTFASNISEKVDFNVSYTWNGNQVENSTQENQNNQYSTHTVGGNLNLIFWKGFVLRSDIQYQMYDGISDEFDTSYALLNGSIAKKFLKDNAGEVSLSVYDLLNQNQSVTQNVTAAYFEEQESLVLNQYFMLSFMYTIRNFKKG